MAATGTPTPNLGLRIPQGTDPASVDDINYNSNLLDTKLGAVGNDSVQDQIDALNSKIALSEYTTFIPSYPTNASSFGGDNWYKKCNHTLYVRLGVTLTNVTTTGYAGRVSIPHNLPTGIKPDYSMPIIGTDGGIGVSRGEIDGANITVYPNNAGTNYFSFNLMYLNI